MPTFRILFEGVFAHSLDGLEVQGFYATRFAIAESESAAILLASNELYDELIRDFPVPERKTVKLSVDRCNAAPDEDFRLIRGFTFF